MDGEKMELTTEQLMLLVKIAAREQRYACVDALIARGVIGWMTGFGTRWPLVFTILLALK